MNNNPVGGRSSETQFYSIDMNNNKLSEICALPAEL
jgi:hypothetical protein